MVLNASIKGFWYTKIIRMLKERYYVNSAKKLANLFFIAKETFLGLNHIHN